MMDFYSDLVKQYGLHSIIYASSITGLCWLLFIVRYFSSNTERTAWTKFFDIIFMFFYIALFGTYLIAGTYIGNMFLTASQSEFVSGSARSG